jgi:uncharacterized protein YciI
MLFAIHCLDHPDAAALRLAHYEAHKACLAAAGRQLVLAGPLLGKDGSARIGSLLVIEATSLAEAQAFNDADPFRQNGVWASVQIHPFLLLTHHLQPEQAAP